MSDAPDLDALTDALFGPNDLKGLGVFAALGTPVELREWLKERIAPKVQELLRGAVEERDRLRIERDEWERRADYDA